jgi:flagellar biosynthetic protein FliR
MVVSIAQTQFFFLALTRVLATIVHVPVLGGENIPNTVKVGLGVFLTMLLIPWQTITSDAETLPLILFVVQIAQEILIGTLAGFAVTLTFSAIRIAGEMLGIGSGFSSSKVLNPAFGDSASSLDQLFVMVALLLFMVLNGHHIFIAGLARSFSIIPVNGPLPDLQVEPMVEFFAQMISTGVQLSLPVVGALLLTDLTLGLLSRVAPQVQVFFLGLPLKIGVALFVLGISFSVMLPVMRDLFNQVGSRMIEMLGG